MLLSPRTHPLSLLLLALSNSDIQRMKCITTYHVCCDRLANTIAREHEMQVLGIIERVPIQRQQNITNQHASLLGWTLLLDPDDQQTMFVIATGSLGGGQFNKLAADTQIPAFDYALLCQCLGNLGDDIQWYCQWDTINQTGRE